MQSLWRHPGRLVATLIISCNFLYWFGRNCIRPAAPLLLHERLSPETLGWLLSLQSFLPIFLSLSAGALGDRYGHAKVLLAGAVASLLAAVGFVVGFQETTPDVWLFPLWSFALSLSGLAWLFFWVALQSLATQPLVGADAGSAPGVSRMIYSLSLTMSLGLIAGPPVTGALLEWGGSDLFWMFQLALAVGHAALCLWLARLVKSGGVFEPRAENAHAAGSRPKRRSFWTLGFPEFIEAWPKLGGRSYVAVILASLIVLFSVDLMATFVPAHLGEAGVSVTLIGIILIGGHVAGVILRLALAVGWIHFSDRAGLMGSLFLCVAGLALTSVIPPGFGWIWIGVALGLGIGLAEPVGMHIIAHHAAPERRGVALGGRVLANRVGMFLAPILGFQAFAAWGPLGGGFALAGLVAVITVGVWWLFQPTAEER